jgi:hypothetical protein
VLGKGKALDGPMHLPLRGVICESRVRACRESG